MEPEQKARTQVEPVGYKSPPVEHQFPNPKRQVGRKKGTKNKPKGSPELTDSEQMALVEAKRLIGPPGAQIETACAVTRAQAKTGVQGGTNAQKAYLARIDTIQQKQKAVEDARLSGWEEYVQRGEDLLERADPEQLADLERVLLPHPHDVEVDWQKRKIRFLGPANALERRIFRELAEHLDRVRPIIIAIRAEIEAEPHNWDKQVLYMRFIGLFADSRALLPERMWPSPLSKWERDDILFWYESPEWKARNKPKRRRLVKNAGLLVAGQPDKEDKTASDGVANS